MIQTCEGFVQNQSVSRLFRYLDKTNQDLVIMRKEAGYLPNVESAQARISLVTNVVEDITIDREEVSLNQVYCTCPPGTLFRSSVVNSKSLEKWFQRKNREIQSISFNWVSDLGIRSSEGSLPLGVILKGRVQLTDQSQRKVLRCYVLPYQHWLKTCSLIARCPLSRVGRGYLLTVDGEGKFLKVCKYH